MKLVDEVHGHTVTEIFKKFDDVQHAEEYHGNNTKRCPRCQLLKFLVAVVDKVEPVEPL